MPDVLTLRRPDDFHLHLRDGPMLRAVLPYTTQQFARAVVMPNLKPPVTDIATAKAYRARIIDALEGEAFEPLMTLYLCDSTDPEMIRAAYAEGVIHAVKYYPAGATTHSEYGVTAPHKVSRVLEVMQEIGVPLLIHGEATDPTIDIFDREARFIENTLMSLVRDFPALKIVLEHITTQEAAEWVAAGDHQRLAATMTPQHLMFNRNAIFMGGIRPHYYCLPVLKREKHRLALRKAATSGLPCFFLGTDSAPHAKHTKEAPCGCAGIFNAPVAMAAYASVFEAENALDKLENFASVYGANFYGLPLNSAHLTLVREEIEAPSAVLLSHDESIEPFLAGEKISWRIAAV